MTTVSFTESTGDDAKAAVAEPEPESKAVVVKQDASPAMVQSEVNQQYVEGEVTREDIATPRLNIVGKTGELSNSFDSGSFVLSKTYDLGKEPLSVAVLYAKKLYREAADFDDKETTPRVFNTAAEVAAAGLRVGRATTRAYGEEAGPEAHLLLFIEAPKDLDEAAAEAFDVTLPSGKLGALALYTAAKTSYNTVGKVVFTALAQNRTIKESGLPKALWSLKASLEKWEGKSWYQGVLTPAGRLEDADVEYLKEFAQL